MFFSSGRTSWRLAVSRGSLDLIGSVFMGFQLTFRLLGCDRIRDRTFFSAGGRVFRLSSSWVTLIEFVVAIWNCEGVFASLFVEGEHVLKLKINLKTGQYCKYSKLFWVGNNICTGKSGEQFIEAQFDGDFLLGLVGDMKRC